MSPRGAAALLLAVLLAVACYLPALGGEPLAEDRLLILENPATRSPLAALASFTRPFWDGIKSVQPYYRPLPLLSWSIERKLAGPSPAVFHAANIALHALNAALAALLAFGLARLARGLDLARTVRAARGDARAAPGPEPADPRGVTAAPHPPSASPAACAAVAGALVAVHPLHSEPVAALYGRPDLLAASGTLLFLNLAVRGSRKLSLLALAAAMLSKESAILIPLLVPAVFAAAASGRSAAALTTGRGRLETPGAWRRLAPLRAALAGGLGAGVIGGIYLMLRRNALGSLLEPRAVQLLDNPMAGAGGPERWLTPLAVLARTARIAVWPDALCADRGYDTVPLATGPGDPWVLAGGALLASLVMAVLVLAFRRSPWALPPAAALLAWLPASSLIAMAPVLMAERLAYLPSILLCVLAGGGWAALMARAGPAGNRAGLRIAAVGTLVIVIAALGARSFARASDFRDEITFYGSDTRQCPRSAKASYNLGNALARQGRHEEAVRAFEAAASIDSSLAVAHSNRGASLLALRRLDEAASAYRQALDADPGLVTARASLSGILYMKGQLEEALEEARSALASHPSPEDARQIRELVDRIRKRLDESAR